MRLMRIVVAMAVLLVTAGGMAAAQDGGGDPKGSLERRLELAKKMHEFRPASEQVNDAIEAVVRRMPENQREPFRLAMKNVLNYKAIEKISIDAMAEVYTVRELELMVDYYSHPETRNITDKYPQYWKMVQPEIMRMLDKAMMRVKTGGTGP